MNGLMQYMPARTLNVLASLLAEKLETAQVKKMVDQVWQARLAAGDPLEALLHTEQVCAAIPPSDLFALAVY